MTDQLANLEKDSNIGLDQRLPLILPLTGPTNSH